MFVVPAGGQKINKRLADMPGLSRERSEMIERKINDYRHSAGASHCFGDPDTLDVLARKSVGPDTGSGQYSVRGCTVDVQSSGNLQPVKRRWLCAWLVSAARVPAFCVLIGRAAR